jgi:hypothetical protein
MAAGKVMLFSLVIRERRGPVILCNRAAPDSVLAARQVPNEGSQAAAP